MPTCPAYCVIHLSNRNVAYLGFSIRLAAVALVPGTVFASGSKKHLAEQNARIVCEGMRRERNLAERAG